MNDTPKETVVHKTVIRHDFNLTPFLLLAMLAFWLLGTQHGNRELCERGWEPTYIECTKVRPDAK